MLEFRWELAWVLINNPHRMTAPQSAVKTRAQTNPFGLHQLSTCPKHTSFHDDRDFNLGAPHPYNQFTVRQFDVPNGSGLIAHVFQPTGYALFIDRNTLVRWL